MDNSLELDKKNNNCLSLIRIIAAIQVILGHMIEHLDLSGNATILHATYFFRGVPIFFAISGFLIWFSVEKSNDYVEYLKKRFWRIYPELWIAVLIEIVALVVLYEGWEIKSLIVFVFTQSTIFQFWTPTSLRGYGVGTPNGAIWTIGVMIQFYLVAYALYKLMHNRKMILWILGFVASFGISWGGSYILHKFIQIEMIGKLYDQTIFKYFWLFYIGMFISEFLDKVLPVLKKYWFAFLIISFVFFWTEWDLFSAYWLGWSVFLTAGLIGFAYKYPQYNIPLDISYGLFLYHMTVVNVFVVFGLKGRWSYALFVLLIASFLAYLSAITIGRLSKNKKSRLLHNS